LFHNVTIKAKYSVEKPEYLRFLLISSNDAEFTVIFLTTIVTRLQKIFNRYKLPITNNFFITLKKQIGRLENLENVGMLWTQNRN